jgi:VIT1/CCC1 family predicted Fe2+/Mn2+ transporter
LFPAAAYIGALVVSLLIAISIIAAFNYYLSVAKERPFKRAFSSCPASAGVAAISFVVGLVVKNVLGIDL